MAATLAHAHMLAMLMLAETDDADPCMHAGTHEKQSISHLHTAINEVASDRGLMHVEDGWWSFMRDEYRWPKSVAQTATKNRL